MTPSALLCLIPAAIVLAAAGGCERKIPTAKPATQVAAKVDADEITIHQVNEMLARTPNVAPDAAGRVRREVLEKLIDQQLARQQALKRSLEQSPRVLVAIEAARSEILARTYLENVTAAQTRPTAEEIRRYYAEHPELFAQRRVYSIEEIVVVATPGIAPALRDRLAKARTMQEVAEWLQTQGVAFVPNRGVRAAEQLPLGFLPRMQAMKDGEMQLFESDGGGLQVVRLVASRLDPVDEATAAPKIQQYLFNRRSSDAVAKEFRQLRAQAKIEYVGEFANAAAEKATEKGAGGPR